MCYPPGRAWACCACTRRSRWSSAGGCSPAGMRDIPGYPGAEDNEHMGSASPVTRPAADRTPGDRAPGRLAAFSARAARELLFCLVEVPLGLCVLALPFVLSGSLFGLTLLVNGSYPSPRSGQARPDAAVAVLGAAIIVLLLALLVLTPRIAR